MIKQTNWHFTADCSSVADRNILSHYLAELDSRYCVYALHEGPTGPFVRGYVAMNKCVREAHMRQRVPLVTWTPSRLGSSIVATKNVKTGTDVVETGYCPRPGVFCNVIE